MPAELAGRYEVVRCLGAGTHLRVEQSGFRPDQRQAYGGAKAGWPQFLEKLEQVAAKAG